MEKGKYITLQLNQRYIFAAKANKLMSDRTDFSELTRCFVFNFMDATLLILNNTKEHTKRRNGDRTLIFFVIFFCAKLIYKEKVESLISV